MIRTSDSYFTRTQWILVLCLLFASSCSVKKKENAASNLHIHDEVTIDEIQEAYRKGEYSIVQLTQYYLNRIDTMNTKGVALRAVITVNPDAIQIAEQLDAEYKSGKVRGPLHGIPVLLKDNIDTGDKMPCTVGVRAMKESYPLQDSPLAAQLRAAGAVILGKTNLSELANFHSSTSSSGWSGLGGQTKNPYDLSRNPCGSSAGSGVAVAANFCVLAIGTETNGSIMCPSNNNGVVGIKPTVGLISRTGIVPISFTQDTGGPMTRAVRDAAIALGAMTAIDSADRKMLAPDRVAHRDYTKYLKTDGLRGKRIGYYKSPLGGNTRMTAIMEEAVAFFKLQGVTVVEVDNLLGEGVEGSSYPVLLYEFKDGINNYLSSLGPDAPVKNLTELIEKISEDSMEMHYFEHDILRQAQAKGDLNTDEYKKALTRILKGSREEGIDKVMKENNLHAIIAPTGGPAWKTDLTLGDHFGIYSSSPAAIAGYPSISVPMGQLDGLPVGLSIFGRAWSEAELIEMAYSFEQGTKHRFTPSYKSCNE